MAKFKDKEELAQAIVEKVQESTAQYHQWFEPQWKSRSDAIKTVVSLSSGSVVFSVAFSSLLRDLQAVPIWRYLIVFSFGMFTLSLILSVIALWTSTRVFELQAGIFNKRKSMQKAFVDAVTKDDFDKAFRNALSDVVKPIARHDRLTNNLFWVSLICFCLAIICLAIVGAVQLWPKPVLN